MVYEMQWCQRGYIIHNQGNTILSNLIISPLVGPSHSTQKWNPNSLKCSYIGAWSFLLCKYTRSSDKVTSAPFFLRPRNSLIIGHYTTIRRQSSCLSSHNENLLSKGAAMCINSMALVSLISLCSFSDLLLWHSCLSSLPFCLSKGSGVDDL